MPWRRVARSARRTPRTHPHRSSALGYASAASAVHSRVYRACTAEAAASETSGLSVGGCPRARRYFGPHPVCQLTVLSFLSLYTVISASFTPFAAPPSPRQTQAAREIHRLSPFIAPRQRTGTTVTLRWLSLRPTAVIGSSSLCLLWRWGPSGRRRAKSRTSLPW